MLFDLLTLGFNFSTWDTPLHVILGDECQFPDQFRTEMVCLRDVLAHKVGIELGETDFGYITGNFEREDIIRFMFFEKSN